VREKRQESGLPGTAEARDSQHCCDRWVV
jgi:hypothetical protein